MLLQHGVTLGRLYYMTKPCDVYLYASWITEDLLMFTEQALAISLAPGPWQGREVYSQHW